MKLKVEQLKEDMTYFDYSQDRAKLTPKIYVSTTRKLVLVPYKWSASQRSDIQNRSYIAYFKRNTDTIWGGQFTENAQARDLLASLGLDDHWGMFYVDDFARVMQCSDIESATEDWFDTVKNAIEQSDINYVRNSSTNEIGVELELESADPFTSGKMNELADTNQTLIHDVGHDCSVHNGCEIRFNHPSLKGWKLKDVSKILNKAKELGLTTKWYTAGMHIHVSHKGIKSIVKTFEANLPKMQDILYPINCRRLRRGSGFQTYGVERNIYRDQSAGFGTLEIRAWNATMDPKLFMARVKFSKYLVDYLSKVKKNLFDTKNFFSTMPQEQKNNYLYMVDHPENIHEWGMPREAIVALMA